jgi:hypothetical protein
MVHKLCHFPGKVYEKYPRIFIYALHLQHFTMETKTVFAIVAVVAAIGLAATVATSSIAYAKISPVTTDTGCTNPAGHSPGGQQPTCTGGGLTQQSTTENQNPAGHAPPGQNP